METVTNFPLEDGKTQNSTTDEMFCTTGGDYLVFCSSNNVNRAENKLGFSAKSSTYPKSATLLKSLEYDNLKLPLVRPQNLTGQDPLCLSVTV